MDELKQNRSDIDLEKQEQSEKKSMNFSQINDEEKVNDIEISAI